MSAPADFVHLAATGTGTIGGTGSGGTLQTVNVNTGAASAVLTLRHGSSSGTIIAVIDATAKNSYDYRVYLTNGLYYELTGGNADVTMAYG